jgi:hypothetical protein
VRVGGQDISERIQQRSIVCRRCGSARCARCLNDRTQRARQIVRLGCLDKQHGGSHTVGAGVESHQALPAQNSVCASDFIIVNHLPRKVLLLAKHALLQLSVLCDGVLDFAQPFAQVSPLRVGKRFGLRLPGDHQAISCDTGRILVSHSQRINRQLSARRASFGWVAPRLAPWIPTCGALRVTLLRKNLGILCFLIRACG